MTSEIKDEFKAPLDLKEKEFLGKKTVKLSSIKEKMNKNNKKIESDSDSDEELNKYKNALSGRFNIKNIIMNKESIIGVEKDWTPEDYKNSTPIITKPSHNTKISQLLSILPKPKNKVYDKTSGLQSVTLKNNENIKVNLTSNPDNLDIDNNNEYKNGPVYGNVRDINIEELVDRNWQSKYLANLNNEDGIDKKKMFEPSKVQKSKNHITSLAYDFLSSQGEEELKKSNDRKRQMKTKGKYGW